MTDKMRIIVADDHPILLGGLRNLIEMETGFDLVGHATSGNAALKLIQDKLPDVAILDISMPEFSGIALARRLSEECPSVRILILTVYEDRSFLMQALSAGANGYVLKRSAAENLIQAIRAVKLGELYIDPNLAHELKEAVATKTEKTRQFGDVLKLTEREASVIKFSARGLTIKEIAARMQLSAKTVETYKSRATEKLHLNTRAEIVRFASTQGWLEDV